MNNKVIQFHACDYNMSNFWPYSTEMGARVNVNLQNPVGDGGSGQKLPSLSCPAQ